VRVVLSYSTGVVRGQIKIEGGTLPDNTRLSVTSHCLNPGSEQNSQTAEVDARGRFKIEGLSPGNYELELQTTQPELPRVKQTVTVENGAEMEVTLVLNLSPKNEGGQ